MRLNISPPEEYSGSSDLKVYETFVAGVLQWLRLHGLLGVKYTETQVQFLGMQLKGNASEWFTSKVECPVWPIRDWSLESVIMLQSDYWRPMMELLSLMVVMSEGLGFNLCVVPFLNICVLNLSQRVGSGRCWR